jgi:hypothetical protein
VGYKIDGFVSPKAVLLFGYPDNSCNRLDSELYEPGLGVKEFEGFDDIQPFLACFWNNLQLHIKVKTRAPFEKKEKEIRK